MRRPMITLDATGLAVLGGVLLVAAGTAGGVGYLLLKRRLALVHRRIDELVTARDDLGRDIAYGLGQLGRLQGGIDWLVAMAAVDQASERVRRAQVSGRLSPAAAERLRAYLFELSREGLGEVTRVAPESLSESPL
jgi:hypothetical protein